ncbi:MAG: ABC transporter substrate-binding protein [Vulcanimicrobiaceae bacterium]
MLRISLIRTLLAGALIALVSACAPSVRPQRVVPTQRRIVALIPAFTEDLFAIGAGHQVVGVSRFSDFPSAARALPRVADFSSIDIERIIALHPDIVVAIASQGRLIEPLIRAGVDVRIIPNDSYADIFSAIGTLGRISGHAKQARGLVQRLQRSTAALHAATRTFKRRPSVFIALGTEPIWTAGEGSYIARLIAIAGGRNAAADLRQPYAEYSEEALLRAQPDAIVYGSDTKLASVLNREPWRDLRAVREGHVYQLPDSDWLYRPGPRYVKGLHWLIARLTPLAQ